MNKLLKNAVVFMMTFFIVVTTFSVNVSANEDLVYLSEDGTYGVLVEKILKDEELVVGFKEYSTEKSTNTVESILVNDSIVKPLESGEYIYQQVIGENGNYKYIVTFTRTELIELSNGELFEKEIKSDIPVSFDIDTIKDSTVEINFEVVDEKVEKSGEEIANVEVKEDAVVVEEKADEIIEEEVEAIIEEKTKETVDYYVPKTGEVISLTENQITTYASNNVSIGGGISGSNVTVTWLKNPSFYWNAGASGYPSIFVNGEIAYCIEPLISGVSTGVASSKSLEEINELRVMHGYPQIVNLTYAQREKLVLLANYGYEYEGHQTNNYRWATQRLIWQELGFSVSGGNNVSYEMGIITDLVNSHISVPDFHGTIQKVKLNETITLTDPLLSNFNVNTNLTSGLTVLSKTGNTITLQITSKNASLFLSKKQGIKTGTSLVYTDTVSQSVMVAELADPVRTFIDFEVSEGNIEITKQNDAGNALPGVVYDFSMNADMSSPFATITTNTQGKALVDNIEDGITVYYRERSTVSPYILDSTIYNLTIVGGETITATRTNKEAVGRIEITKKDNHGNSLSGVVYEIRNSSNTVLETLTTSANGTVTSRELPLGNYTVNEISVPNNIVIDKTPINVTISYEDMNTPVVIEKITVTNNWQRGTVVLTKVENNWDTIQKEYNGIKLENAKIELRAKSNIYEGSKLIYNANDLVDTKVTDINGLATFTNLPIGEYYAKEIEAPKGYVLYTGVWDVSVTYDKSVVTPTSNYAIENQTIYGKGKLIKTNGDRLLLENAVFGLYKADGTFIEEATTDKNGEILTPNLRFGKYYFQEIKSPQGYWTDKTKIEFEISEHESIVHVTMSNKLVEVHVEWNKTNEEGLPLEGVGFKIRNIKNGEFVTLHHADGKEIISENIWYTDAKGDVFVKGLIVAGEYELVEVAPLEGYQPIAPLKFTVDENQDYIDLGTLIGFSLDLGDIVNYWNRGNLKITKLDIDSNEYLSGFGFNLYDLQNNLIGYYETGADGTVTIQNLKYGYYVVEEIKVGGDYGIDPKNARQEVFIEEHGRTYEVTFKNKYADIKTNASFVEREKDEPNIVTLIDVVKYTDLQVGKEYVLDGVLMYKDSNKPVEIDGELVKGQTTFTPTSKDGSVEVKFTFDASKLESKTLVVFEDLSREGKLVVVHHDINDIDQTVEIPEVGTTLTYTERDKESPNIVTLTDEVRYSGLVVGKEYTVKGQLQDGITGLPLLIDGKTVEGETTFVATQKEGTVNIVFTFDQNKLETEKIVAFEHLYEGERLIAVHTDINDVNQTVEVYTITINKKDSLTKEVLKDAEFTMYDSNGMILDIQVTDEFGVAKFTIFEGESVEIKETSAPKGYILSDEVIRITGSKEIDGNHYSVEYFNDIMPTVQLPATGIGSSTSIYFAITFIIAGLFLMYKAKKSETLVTKTNSKWF